LSYAQGAVLARRGVSVSGPLSIHLVGGVAANLALGGRLQRDRETAEIDFQKQVDLLQTDQLRRWDVSGIIGVGLEYPVGRSSRAALEIRYNRGVRSVFERLPTPDSPFPLTGSSSFHHDVITASLSYTLPLASLF
jgi:opacity protein-like surface antigen